MEESQNVGHEHPLLLLSEEQISNGSEKAECSKCGEKVSAPSSGCLECGFYLHKQCAEAPLEINHPFHLDHPLVLREPPFVGCNFCEELCTPKRFVYRCSCGFNFHIKCALFTYNIADKNFKELEQVAHEDSLISTEDVLARDIKMCFGCWEPLENYAYFSRDCGFNLHKKCAELPLKIDLMCQCKHPLVLQFNSRESLSCKICLEKTRRGRLVYCCSLCKFVVHIECVSLSPTVENKRYQHPFTLFQRRSSSTFICDACGVEGNYVACICCKCNILVHKKCISLPRVIKSKWHDHRIFHTYFLQEDFKSSSCVLCHGEVNLDRGSYYCSDCNIIFHVNCVTKGKDSYFIVSLENEDEKYSESFTVIEKNDAGKATKIRHFRHKHNLTINDKIAKDDNCCDGCLLPVSHSFYHCPQCDFFLHKTCAELPKKKHVGRHHCGQLLKLTSGFPFSCEECHDISNGFAYKCYECKSYTCLRCVIALSPGALTCQGHEHPLRYYKEYRGQCNACGNSVHGALHCKDCNFALHYTCFSLPIRARHKCDEHLLRLTYHDDNNYSECHYCDICEERRDPNRWFYQCTICDNSAHIYCILGEYPFIKLRGIFKQKDHPHRLTFVKKKYYYPECIKCGQPCQDLALECAKPGCNYIVHWNCIVNFHLPRQWRWHLPERKYITSWKQSF